MSSVPHRFELIHTVEVELEKMLLHYFSLFLCKICSAHELIALKPLALNVRLKWLQLRVKNTVTESPTSSCILQKD